MIGQTFGHYHIESRLGAGGMGEVYLARDTRLDRLVALKVLPEAFAADEQRLKRFLQEAKVTSSLKHPNIGHVYEIGEVNGTYYLAIEYVEGPTLGARLAAGPLPIGELVDLAVQAADAPAEAHSMGILHRDIKPEVLDFGLARIDAKAAADGASSETRTQALTNPGVVMGTPRYMSPEQALRSDLFSFGMVLYQMAPGTAPFRGQHHARNHRRDPAPGGCRAGAAQPQNPARPGAHHSALAGEGPGAALPDGCGPASRSATPEARLGIRAAGGLGSPAAG
ncbi:MAG TPA: serine/threonine-protein kinase [Bryobacteraceae bacterium]|nr:serine/threonine-protein kinase [Bryobacteraceae bacterium]